jgi:predicted transcriptional regulator
MRVLLSINPNHVENIFSGAKTYEYRRKIFTRPGVSTVLIYCTRPVAKLVGEFEIARILRDNPRKLWRRTHEGSGITKEFFERYFDGVDIAYALEIGEVRKFPISIRPTEMFENFHPPQSYMYV